MSKQQILRLAVAQLNFLVGDIDGNADKIIAACDTAWQQHRAHAIVFPELALTGYPPEDLLLRADLHQRVSQALAKICQHVTGIVIILGLPLRDAQGIRNAAVVIEQGKVIAQYYKQALPNYSVFDEKRYFIAGDTACVVSIAGIPTGITICEDVWVEQPTRLSKQAGAQWLINLNASPFHLDKDRERHDIVRQRIHENGIPMVYANLIGGQDELVFDGGSFAMDAHGTVIWSAPPFELGLFYLDIVADVAMVQITPQPVSPALALEDSVYRALVLGVRDYINKNNFAGVVIGLSGGIDSALTLKIAVDAIGAQRVEAVMMPSRFTATMSREDAQAQAEILGVAYQEISIEPAFEVLLAMLKEEFRGLPADVTEENIQARCRGLLLMAISNKKRKIVLTTGNKSEMAVGYATLYGDMAGGFDVLKDVPKTWVFRLATWCNRQGVVIPQRVIDRPPSAELAPGQKDVDSLPPYDILDAILERYVEKDEDIAMIVAAGYDPQTVQRVIGMVDRAEYKRRQAAPGVRITRRAFGRDRRYPITSGFGRGKI